MFRSFVLELTQVVVVVVVLAGLLGIRQIFKVVPLRPALRARLDRMLPVIELLAVVGFVLWSVWFLFPKESGAGWWATGVLAVGFVVAGWFALRDLVSGVILRSEKAYAPGQWIQAGSVEGYVADLGYRTMEIESDSGTRIRIPYSQLSRAAVATADRSDTSKAHTFELELSGASAVGDLTTKIRSATLTAFWSSPQRDPYVHYIDQRDGRHRFEVVAFCLDDAYAIDLEQSVRRQMRQVEEGLSTSGAS